MLVAGNKKPRTKAGLGLRGRQADLSQPPETTKPVSDGLYRCSNMAEAMGFELMDLLQSTVFKFRIKLLYFNILETTIFRTTTIYITPQDTSCKALDFDCGNDFLQENTPSSAEWYFLVRQKRPTASKPSSPSSPSKINRSGQKQTIDILQMTP